MGADGIAVVGRVQGGWEDMQGKGKKQNSLLLVDKLQMVEVEVQSTWSFAVTVAPPYMEEPRRYELLQVSESCTTLIINIIYQMKKKLLLMKQKHINPKGMRETR